MHRALEQFTLQLLTLTFIPCTSADEGHSYVLQARQALRQQLVRSYPFQERISRLTFIVLFQNLRRCSGEPVNWANPPMSGEAVPTGVADVTQTKPAVKLFFYIIDRYARLRSMA
jgi:hypothetical protein